MDLSVRKSNIDGRWYFTPPEGGVIHTETRRATEWLRDNWQAEWYDTPKHIVVANAEREARKEAIARRVGFGFKGRDLLLYATARQRHELKRNLKDGNEPTGVLEDFTAFMAKLGWAQLDSDVLLDAPGNHGPFPKDAFTLSQEVRYDGNLEVVGVKRAYYGSAEAVLHFLTELGAARLVGIDVDMVWECEECGYAFDKDGRCLCDYDKSEADEEN